MLSSTLRRFGYLSIATISMAFLAHAAPIQALSAEQPAAPTIVPDTASLTEDPAQDVQARLVSDKSAEPDAQTLCLAKVVLREAANQSLDGQIAVAQVVINRTKSGRFPDTICGVAKQRGQFFDVDAYNPTSDPRWEAVVHVAEEVRAGEYDPVVGNAVYFHAARARGGYCPRQVARLGDHIFCS